MPWLAPYYIPQTHSACIEPHPLLKAGQRNWKLVFLYSGNLHFITPEWALSVQIFIVWRSSYCHLCLTLWFKLIAWPGIVLLQGVSHLVFNCLFLGHSWILWKILLTTYSSRAWIFFMYETLWYIKRFLTKLQDPFLADFQYLWIFCLDLKTSRQFLSLIIICNKRKCRIYDFNSGIMSKTLSCELIFCLWKLWISCKNSNLGKNWQI